MKNTFSYILLFLFPIILFGQESLEDKIWKNHLRAIDEMGSSFDIYTVLKCQNYHTKEITEVSMRAIDAYFIIHDEYNLKHRPKDYSKIYKALTKKNNRLITLKNKKSIERVNRLALYTKEELDSFKTKIDINEIIKELEKTKKLDYTLLDSENLKQKMMYIHLLFDNGFSVFEGHYGFGIDYEN